MDGNGASELTARHVIIERGLDGLERKIIGSELHSWATAVLQTPQCLGGVVRARPRRSESWNQLKIAGQGSQTGSHPHPIPGYASRQRIRIPAGQRL